MLVSLLSVALAGDVELLHSTGVSGDGRQDVVTGDFDGDGALDVAAPFAESGREAGVGVWLSESDSYVRLYLDEPVPELTLVAAPWADQGADLFIGVPDDASFGIPGGTVFLVTEVGEQLDGRTLGAVASNAWIGEADSRFGASVLPTDLDGDSIPEILIGAPAETGRVYVFEHLDGSVHDVDDARAVWFGSDEVQAFGSTLGVLSSGLVLVGGTQAVAWFDRADWLTIQGLDAAVGLQTGLPTGLDLEPLGELVFGVTAEEKVALVALEGANAAVGQVTSWTTGSVDGAMTAGAHVRAGDGVVLVDVGAGDGVATELATDSWAVAAAALTSSGDHNGDGCDDVVASDPSDGSLYALLAECAGDTGDTGGDTGDTGGDTSDSTPETGDSGETGADSGDTAVVAPVCEDFGYSCAGGDDVGRGLVLLGLLLTLVGRERRRR
ncbi:MAG: hypothetical protein GY913_17240 [Proteobacteria bacterium]|nr:hypothetical protein [Pseudomonadota bacterium]MCP4918651.1 hypothetical protein [Pseudomonadota bacterium]